VGLSTPGVVDPAHGVVLAAHNLHAWTNVPIGEALADGFGAPVAVENDVNLAALGEHRRGTGKGVDPLVFIAAGTGIGAGIILGGRIHRGAHLAAGEVKALPSGVRDESGREGGVEAVASGPAILRRAAARGVTAPVGGLTTELVFALARAGDSAAAAVIDEAAVALARAAAALAVAIDPAMIVLGGGLSLQGEDLLAPIREHLAAFGLTRTPVVHSALGVDAQLHGAIVAARDRAIGETIATGAMHD
jgi:glucokinase